MGKLFLLILLIASQFSFSQKDYSISLYGKTEFYLRLSSPVFENEFQFLEAVSKNCKRIYSPQKIQVLTSDYGFEHYRAPRDYDFSLKSEEHPYERSNNYYGQEMESKETVDIFFYRFGLGSVRSKLVDIEIPDSSALNVEGVIDKLNVYVYDNVTLTFVGSISFVNISFYGRPFMPKMSGNIDVWLYSLDSCKRLLFKHAIKSLNVFSSNLPDTLIFVDRQKPLDLTHFQEKEGKECKLFIGNNDIEGWNLNYRYFSLLTKYNGTSYSASKLSELYHKILEIQKEKGYLDGYEKIDKETRRFNYTKDSSFYGNFLNWLDSNWWEYGYRKQLIFRNSLIILLSVFAINLLFYRKLISETYIIEEILIADAKIRRNYFNKPILRSIRRAINCLLYTSYLFWGWKLGLDKIRLSSNLPLALWVIFQYLVGIICLAYLVGYIISR